jgi:hypothetical protein
MYAADILSFLATRSDVNMANYWSLIGDSIWGTFYNYPPNPRPVYFIFHEFSNMIKSFTGTILVVPVTLASSYTVKTPNVGFTSAATFIPVTALALTSASDNHVNLLLINKDLTKSLTINLTLADFNLASTYSNYTMTSSEFYASNPMVQWSDYEVPGPAASLNWTKPTVTKYSNFNTLSITMKAHSILSVRLDLAVKLGGTGSTTSATTDSSTTDVGTTGESSTTDAGTTGISSTTGGNENEGIRLRGTFLAGIFVVMYVVL